jgi:hypothetical protein
MGALRPSAGYLIGKSVLQRRSKALTQMRTWISCHQSLLASWVLYAGSINMTNAVDSLNVENIVEGSRCATALAPHAGIPEPLVLRFEECGGSLPPGGSLWCKENQGEAVQHQRATGAEAVWRLPPYLRTKSCLEQIHVVSRLPQGPGAQVLHREGEYYLSLAGAFRVIWRRLWAID